MYTFKDVIAVPSNNYSTRLKSKSNFIVPKFKTVFGHKLPHTSLLNLVMIRT